MKKYGSEDDSDIKVIEEDAKPDKGYRGVKPIPASKKPDDKSQEDEDE